MEAITVDVVSEKTIKPVGASEPAKEPLKICFLDQIALQTYIPLVFFYPPQQNDQNTLTLSTRLTTSLSETLARFYPFSGRLKKDNLFVHDFQAGVPFKEARVNCRMFDFLANRSRTFAVNQFLPCRPLSNESSNPDMPLLAVQLTRFACGGTAVGVCVSHKLADMSTCAALLNSWAATTRGGQSDHDHGLDLLEASARFPGVDSLPQFYTSTLEKACFQQGNYKTERFVFDEEALAALKARARTDVVSNPSRVLSLSAFIWRRVMSATKTVLLSENSHITHVMTQVVNIRPPRPTNSIIGRGNLVWGSAAIYDDDDDDDDDKNAEFGRLVELVNESVLKSSEMKSVRGNVAFDSATESLKSLEMMGSCGSFRMLRISSWVNMDLMSVDFGLGKPVWVGVYGGEGGPEMGDLVLLHDVTRSKGIEAWVNLDEKVLNVLRNDAEFLALAKIDPPVNMY